MKVYEKPIRDLNGDDFNGESPDCQTREATALVLSAIYRRSIGVSSIIRIIKFEHDPD
jgi:hypothetical protein